ncbi:MAG: hypothetical protein PHC28_15600 [Flavobacterium sp.]|uniref:hypothetical protein n=1 Tax=Flavobacterium sp. TaxID=239 RepID=UPI002601EB4A|nr:hypothetical protein [Flavobacterium sp.]MDD5151878.1 hypothetical protein [Flavobacterium sp.]
MYSEKEKRLIEFFGYHDLLDKSAGIEPILLYRMMAMKAFKQDLHGKEVDSLRNCINAIDSFLIFRQTPEWDDLIEFS